MTLPIAPVSAVSGPFTAQHQGPLRKFAAVPRCWVCVCLCDESDARDAAMACARRLPGARVWVRLTTSGSFMVWADG